MKYHPSLTVARDLSEASARISAVGADLEAVPVMAAKMVSLAVKLSGVPSDEARAIKKAMLELGGEAAVSAGVYVGEPGVTDVIVMGSLEKLSGLSRRLADGRGGLAEFSAELPRFIEKAVRRRFTVPTPNGDIELGGRPLMMGIINCTPDSFYDGGKYNDLDRAVARGVEMLEAGADILDVGGESTRPGADPVPAEEEVRRVVPVIERLVEETGATVSVDTQKAEVARAAMAAGAAMVNDVSALGDPEMAKVVADGGAALVLMHIKGAPKTMQEDPCYDDLFGEVIEFLRGRMDRALTAGVSEESIIVDPGIGFGKTVDHNLELIRDLWRLRSLGRPILLGPSNKSFIGKTLEVEADDRLEGTAASLVAGVMSGAHVLRIHDVAGMKRYVDMAWAISDGAKRRGDKR